LHIKKIERSTKQQSKISKEAKSIKPRYQNERKASSQDIKIKHKVQAKISIISIKYKPRYQLAREKP